MTKTLLIFGYFDDAKNYHCAKNILFFSSSITKVVFNYEMLLVNQPKYLRKV